MSEQRNLLLAIVLSVGVFLGYDYFFVKKPVPPVGDGPAAGSSVAALPSVPAAPETIGSDVDLSREREAATRGEAIAASGDRVAIRTERVSGSLRLQGARIDDLILSTYKQTVEDGSPPVDLLSPAGSPEGYYAEFGWRGDGTQPVRVPDASTLWTADKDTLGTNDTVTLTWDNGEGLRFIRTLSLDENYMFTVGQTVVNTGDTPVRLHPYGRIVRVNKPQTVNFFILHEGMVGVVDGKLEELDYDDAVKDQKRVQGTTTGGWIGITDKYWLAALVPDQTKRVSVSLFAAPNTGGDNYEAAYSGEFAVVAPGQSVSVENRLFAGAKEFDLLNAYGKSLGITQFNKSIDFGWFWFFTIPFTWALHHLYQLLGNMGLAIIAFTVVLKILFFPLANKSYVSMSRMKLLAPEMKKLQERFKDDRARLNQEMMALYTKEKVNPLSGCMPILLQIPVFFALYKVIFVNIDMRQAPFFGWITDLSVREPITVFNLFGLIPWTPPDFQLFWVGTLPLLMGLSMWAQQKLNPAPADPTQARIMGMLPIIFTFVLAPFAAGLILYWTWNNLLSILQQWIIMKRLDRQKKRSASAS